MAGFEIKEKVAIVTGGASGIGLTYVLELLKKGAKGVTIADVSSDSAQKVLKDIETEFGPNKAIFVQTDVTKEDQFENAFKKTLDTFKHVDILINSAGIYNDAKWQTQLDINLKGVIIGTLLALENYIQKFKSGPEGLIVNISSVTGVNPWPSIPLYSATKFAIHGLTLAFGSQPHFERTKVRIVGVCPGVTITPLVTDRTPRSLGPAYEELHIGDGTAGPLQSLEEAAPHFVSIMERAPPGTIWIVEGGENYQYQMPDRFTMPKIRL